MFSMTQKWLKTNGLWPLYLWQINGIISSVKGGAIMSTSRTRHGLLWVVSVSIAAASILTLPGMLLFSFLIAASQLGLELILGLNLPVVAMLLALIALTIVVRAVASLFFRN